MRTMSVLYCVDLLLSDSAYGKVCSLWQQGCHHGLAEFEEQQRCNRVSVVFIVCAVPSAFSVCFLQRQLQPHQYKGTMEAVPRLL